MWLFFVSELLIEAGREADSLFKSKSYSTLTNPFLDVNVVYDLTFTYMSQSAERQPHG